MQHDDERFGMTEAPSFIKDAAKGIEAAKKTEAEKAEADRAKAERDQCKDELQRATDEKVRLAKDAAEGLSEYHGLELEVRIKAKAKELGVAKDRLRKEVTLLRDGYAAADAVAVMPEVEPWPEEVDGDALLDELVKTIRAYVILEYHDALIVALYLVQTQSYHLWDFCARLNITSPEPRCGKTTAQKVAGELANKAKFADNISPSAVFRWVEQHKPTLVIDEVDQWLTLDSELIQLLTSGYEEGKKAVRNEKVGDSYVPVEFDLYCPCILAGIDGSLKKPQLVDRCITVRLQRKARGQKTKRFRRRECDQLHDLRSMIKRWMVDHEAELAKTQPPVPDEIDDDRAADKWEPLLAIADVAGGEHGVQAREAMLRLCRLEEDNQSVRVKLLADLKDIFEKHSADKLLTEEILDNLIAMESRPWPEFSRGKPLTPSGLARLLKPHKVRPKSVRSSRSGKQKKGYDIGDFKEAFRYLPQDGTTAQAPEEAQTSAENSCAASETCDGTVPLAESHNGTLKPAVHKGCAVVPDKTPPLGGCGDQPDAEDLEHDAEERAAIQGEPEADPLYIPPWLDGRPSRMAKSSI